MRKLVWVIALALGAWGTKDCRADLTAAVLAGVNINNFSTDPDVGSSNHVGLIVGGQVEYALSDNFYLRPGLRFDQKGFTYNATVFGQQESLTATANYIEFPVHLVAKIPAGPSVTPFVFFGPDLGFNVGNSVSGTLNGNDVDTSNASLNFNTIDFALDFGGGIEFPVSPSLKGFVQADYSLGLVNVANSDVSATWKSRGIQITAGMGFPL
jgi:hypothetical protein